MNNSERLLLYTLPRWAGVTALSIKESLSDMWLGGEQAGHHSETPYDPDGYERLRTELRKDFVRVPPCRAFGMCGTIRTVRDLAAAMAEVPQTPVPPPSAMLSQLLPSGEVAMLSHRRMRTALFGGNNNLRHAPRRRPAGSRRRRTRGRNPSRPVS